MANTKTNKKRRLLIILGRTIKSKILIKVTHKGCVIILISCNIFGNFVLNTFITFSAFMIATM